MRRWQKEAGFGSLGCYDVGEAAIVFLSYARLVSASIRFRRFSRPACFSAAACQGHGESDEGRAGEVR